MDPAELEFLAEKETIEIVPTFTHPVMHLIQGDVGPFKPGLSVMVPLWLAVNLRQRQRCRIVTPAWMDVERLEEVLETETEEKFFTELPAENIFVVANIILEAAKEDIDKADMVQKLLKDLWDRRQAKLRTSVYALMQSEATNAKLNFLQSIELNTVRPLLPQAFDHKNRLNLATAAASRVNQQQHNSNSSFMSNTLNY